DTGGRARDGRDGDDACYACPASAGGTYRPFPMLDRRRRPRARCRHRAPAMGRLGLRTDGPDVGHAGPAAPLAGTRGRRPRCRARGAGGPVVGHAGPADPLSGTRGRRTRCRARGAGGPVVGHAGPTTGGPQRRQGAVMARNVFILGLDQHNLEILRRLPGAGELAFHRLLSVEELQGEHIDVPVLLDRAVQQLEAVDGPIDASCSFWVYPMLVMVP